MSKRTTFTTITPLPAGISRQTALDFLHNHLEMIDLNPLVIERHPIDPPAHAGAEEQTCAWYSITDKISYLPGTDLVRGDVTYTCAFHDIPAGLQTHCFAALGLEIRDRWSVGGSAPGETSEVQELGLGAPATGLYIREDVDFKCNVLMAGFVRKTLKKAHGTLVEALGRKAQSNIIDEQFLLQQQDSQSHHHHHSRAGSAAPSESRGDSGSYHSGSNNDEKPFVSSGANQGQPGQGGDFSRPYQPPRLPVPYQGGRPYEQGHARNVSAASSYHSRSEDYRPQQQQQQQQQPIVAEMEGDSSYRPSHSRGHSQNYNQRQY